MSNFKLSATSLENYSRYLSLLSGNTAYVAPPDGSYELIQSTILSSSSTEVSFANLSQYSGTYKHLQLRVVTRNTSNVGTGQLITRFNGDSGNNYTYHALRGNGSAVSSEAVAPYSSILISWNPHGGTDPGNWGVGVADILDWSSTTKNKTVRSFTGVLSYANIVALMSGVWMNTAAISSISIVAEGGNSFAAGSRYSLYGVK